MTTMAITGIVFACIFGGTLLGMLIRALVPAHHLAAESKDLVKLGMGLTGTMAALVLGLMVASAKGSFDTQSNEITQLSANVILLDRLLARYGPETRPARERLRQSVVSALERIWPEDSTQPTRVEGTASSEALFDMVQDLAPKTEAQRSLQAQALKVGADIAQTRWLLFAQKGSSIPAMFLVVLVFWLAIIFASFSLFAPPNPIVVVTLFVCALSVSGAIYLILDLDRPFGGLIQISSEPLRNALAKLRQ